MIATNTPLVDRSQLILPGWRLSDELAARFSALNDDVESLLARNREFEESEVDTGADAADISLAAIRDRRDELRDCKLKILQTLVELFRRRVELIGLAKAELVESAAKAEKDLAAAKDKISRQLEKCGSGLTTMQGWPKTPKAAEIQFSHLGTRTARNHWRQSSPSSYVTPQIGLVLSLPLNLACRLFGGSMPARLDGRYPRLARVPESRCPSPTKGRSSSPRPMI